MAKQFDELPAHESDFATNKKAPYSKDGEIKTNEFTFTAETLSAGGASVSVTTLSTDDSSNYYYEEETTKEMIVLHYTAGRLKGDIGALTTDDNHISVAYVLARDGTIYRLFDDKYWSYHLGSGAVGGNGTGSKRSVAIEISNVGWLDLKNNTELHTWADKHYCDTSDTAAFQKLETAYRGKTYFATYTDAQYASLRNLLNYLCAKHSIPYSFLDDDVRYNVMSATDAAGYKGIASHVNFRSSDKWDIGPAFDWQRLIGSYSYPIDLGKGLAVSTENAEAYYQHTEKDRKGGYYPVGTNTVWHGGLHVHAAKGTLVHACDSGEIVAARLIETIDDGHGHYGSVNFILCRHEVSGATLNAANQSETFSANDRKPWYSLYMHVDPQMISDGNQALKQVAWLRTTAATGLKTKVANLPLRQEPDASKPFDKLAKGAQLKLVTPEPTATKVGNYDWRYVEVTGGDTANHGKTGWIPAQADWTETITDTVMRSELIEQLRSGVARIGSDAEPVTVRSGDALWPIGEYGSPGYRARMVHWEIFSEENLMPSWTQSIDTDDDFNMDAKEIVDLIDQDWFGFDDVLTKVEVDRFYSSNPKAAQLRTRGCQFVLEWGINLDIALPKLRRLSQRVRVSELKERIEPYLWWNDAVAAGVPLPASNKVWHYNPVALLAAWKG